MYSPEVLECIRPHADHFGLRWKWPPIKNAHGANTASIAKGNPKASTASIASLSSKLRPWRGAWIGVVAELSDSFIEVSLVEESLQEWGGTRHRNGDITRVD